MPDTAPIRPDERFDVAALEVRGDALKPTAAIVITGASTGIGAACALHLDGLGFQVFAGVRRRIDGEALERRCSGRLTAISLDVTDPAGIAAVAATVAGAVGSAGIHGLVNNAGIVVAAPLELLPLAELRRQLEVNVLGQVAVTQAFLPLLRQARGRIVNMGSISGRMSTPLLGPYAASKAALAALTDSLRLEVRPWGIAVSLIEPGAIATPIWEKSSAAADALTHAMSPEGAYLYGGAIQAVRRAAARSARHAIPPETVVRAVAHALTAVRPKTRYVVGRDARIRALLARLVPDRLRDRLIARALRLPG